MKDWHTAEPIEEKEVHPKCELCGKPAIPNSKCIGDLFHDIID